LYNGPWDAVKKIYRSNGIAGIFKGQNPTLLREATGYAAYFWAYEKLVQREMRVHNCRREDIAPAKAILFGAAAGYAVCSRSQPIGSFLLTQGDVALGRYLPDRHDQVADSD
jgi:solute carrier family 25 carnitine/acylcarnitine transporter 20/29